jgi:hypothetical protein
MSDFLHRTAWFSAFLSSRQARIAAVLTLLAGLAWAWTYARRPVMRALGNWLKSESKHNLLAMLHALGGL